MTDTISSPIAGCMRWGKWGANFSLHDYQFMVDQCLLNGITAFDHADIYGDYTTEEEFGEVLKGNSALRQQMQLITKCGVQLLAAKRPLHTLKSYNTSAEHIVASVENSLRNFHTDYIDVLLIHRPDPLMNAEEVAGAISTLQQQGKLLAFGVSNFLPHQVDLLRTLIPVTYNQLELSILAIAPFVNGIIDYCKLHGIRPMAWAPLGGGILNDDSHPRYRAIVTVASRLADKYETGLNQVLIAWLLKHPAGILPVIGSTRLERLLQVRYASHITLTREEWFELYTASLGEDVA